VLLAVNRIETEPPYFFYQLQTQAYLFFALTPDFTCLNFKVLPPVLTFLYVQVESDFHSPLCRHYCCSLSWAQSLFSVHSLLEISLYDSSLSFSLAFKWID